MAYLLHSKQSSKDLWSSAFLNSDRFWRALPSLPLLMEAWMVRRGNDAVR